MMTKWMSEKVVRIERVEVSRGRNLDFDSSCHDDGDHEQKMLVPASYVAWCTMTTQHGGSG